MITMTSKEMLDHWKMVLGFAPSREGCSIILYEGIDVDGSLARKIRRWYLDLLDKAPIHLLPLSDLSATVRLSSSDGRRATVEIPDTCRRILAVKLSGWNTAVSPVEPEDAAGTLRRMASPYGHPGPMAPAAIRVGHTLHLFPSSGSLEIFLAVVDPGPEKYILDESLLPKDESEI